MSDVSPSPRTVLGPTQHMIYDILLDPPNENGAHINIFQNIPGRSFAEVESTVHQMLDEGILVNTVDAET